MPQYLMRSFCLEKFAKTFLFFQKLFAKIILATVGSLVSGSIEIRVQEFINHWCNNISLTDLHLKASLCLLV